MQTSVGHPAAIRRAAKISSLDAARTFYFIIASLAIRQALLFFAGLETPPPAATFTFFVRLMISASFLFTVFRFSHGVALVYDIEKKTTETSATPSSKRVELVFAFLLLEVAALFLMSTTLGKPDVFVYSAMALVVCDLLYIHLGNTLRDANRLRTILQGPWYFIRRWNSTNRGTAGRAHVQWALSDYCLLIVFGLTLFSRFRASVSFSGTPEVDWALFLSILLAIAGIADYAMNGEFYFGKRTKGRKLVFVCSPLEAATSKGMSENIRRAQWYCLRLYRSGEEIPFASHGFYPYFLSDSLPLQRKMGTKCATEFLAHCDAIYVYTKSGRNDEKEISQGMSVEIDFARCNGLEIRYCKAEEPSSSFMPSWSPLSFEGGVGPQKSVDFEKPWKRVFVCSPLRGGQVGVALRAAIESNIRLAQWLCHGLVCGDESIAPVSPHAFFPYFTEEEGGELPWLDSAIDLLKTCEAIYVYTPDGLDSKEHVTQGMEKCIMEARSLGIEICFQRYKAPPASWKPATWNNPTLPGASK